MVDVVSEPSTIPDIETPSIDPMSSSMHEKSAPVDELLSSPVEELSLGSPVDPVSAEPSSVEPVSAEPVSVDPPSLDPLSVEPRSLGIPVELSVSGVVPVVSVATGIEPDSSIGAAVVLPMSGEPVVPVGSGHPIVSARKTSAVALDVQTPE